MIINKLSEARTKSPKKRIVTATKISVAKTSSVLNKPSPNRRLLGIVPTPGTFDDPPRSTVPRKLEKNCPHVLSPVQIEKTQSLRQISWLFNLRTLNSQLPCTRTCPCLSYSPAPIGSSKIPLEPNPHSHTYMKRIRASHRRPT